MYKNILVPIAADGDPRMARALDVARTLAADGAKITVLSVVEEVPGYIRSQLPEGQSEQIRRSVEKGLADDLKGTPGVDVLVVIGHSARTILDIAEKDAVDLIVISSHRPEISDIFLGSTASRVVRHAQCAVHVTR
jgi:nucleotide-binding universal stress UspA family protein